MIFDYLLLPENRQLSKLQTGSDGSSEVSLKTPDLKEILRCVRPIDDIC